MKADAQTEAGLMATLEQFKQAYEQRDIERLLALLAPDPDVVLIGTGAYEKCMGLAEIQMQAERDWAQSVAFSLEWGWPSVSVADKVACHLGDFIGNIKVAEQEIPLPLRLTVVLEHRGDNWLWVQMHSSIPAPVQA